MINLEKNKIRKKPTPPPHQRPTPITPIPYFHSFLIFQLPPPHPGEAVRMYFSPSLLQGGGASQN